MTHPPNRRRHLASIGILAAAAMTAAMISAPAAAAPAGTILHAGGATAVKDSYIVVLNDTAVGGKAGTQQAGVNRMAANLANRYGANLGHVYGAALNGFEVRLPEAAAKRLAADPAVAYVEQNHTVSLTATQLNPPWGLDRIDQRNRPLDGRYSYVSTGAGVNVYIIDTGIRTTHNDFGGRASHGYDAIDGSLPADDCNGHGTHVAGTAGGTNYGVAKQARLIAVRVLDCGGGGTWAQVIAGVNWVTSHHRTTGGPSVANMSLGGGYNASLNSAVTNSVNAGVFYAVASGNSAANACNFSPASAAGAVAVNATQNNDARASFSNYGSCTRIFAPGVGVLSAYHTSNTATASLSGTSMASPHVAGAAARVMQRFPNYTPSQVSSYLTSVCTTGVVSNPGSGSPNCLLYLDPTF